MTTEARPEVRQQIWKCACGWRGAASDLHPYNASGGKVCPSCGASGGLILDGDAAVHSVEPAALVCAQCGKERLLSTLFSPESFVCRYCLSTEYVEPAAQSEPAPLTVALAQVFVFQPELTHSIWIDFVDERPRSREETERYLREGVERGEYVGYRFIQIEEEHIGRTWK